ncbi:hypothetical protein G4G27_02125 [Sphingomonas sp. So64.6b]|uniref:hypothetical protein n=1 Tax=Sphingomonas sp. So64.6b TaxID=2997354 RepID=UPI0015FFA51E|nr:hypothetical protein [Sphingomonas sp. So64.6b]QNA82942.1 hypothetical protein G4G27_02125 [Sphingomonas sp. So64.6b]
MTRINPADQVLLLLQEQLNRLGKDRAAPRGRPAPAQGPTPEPMARLRALAGRDGITDEDMKRALVRGLIIQQLGEAIGNDPAFEAVAGDVARIIGASPAGRELLDRAMRQLSAP